MADNVPITAGVGTSVAADDISSVFYQRVKISHGADGSATDSSTDSGLPVQFQTPATAQLTAASVSCSASGANALISGTASQTSRVFKLFIVFAGADTVKFQSATTDLTGLMTVTAGGAIVLDFDGEPWFVTGAAEAFNLTMTTGVQASGRIYYEKSA